MGVATAVTMSDNLSVKDGFLDDAVIRTSESGGIHTPYHKSRLLDGSGNEYGANRPVPVALYATSGSPIVLVADAIDVDTDASSDSISIYGVGPGDEAQQLRVNYARELEVDAITLASHPRIGSAYASPASNAGQVVLGVQVGATPASQTTGNGRLAPLIMDDEGRVYVSFANSVAMIPFTQKGDLLTYDGSTDFVLEVGSDNSILVADSSVTGGLKWLSPDASSPAKFLRGDLVWAVPLGTGGGTSDHGALTGLGDDDHTQYLLTNGTRSMSGGLNMGANAITNVGNVDGRDVSADGAKLDGIESGATADQTGAEIKAAYEGEADTNAFTDAEQTKLSGIAAGAEVNVNADWNAVGGDAEILNKPTLVTDHGALTGLVDDDHTQYVLVDGTRGFSGQVTAPSPTAGDSVANKGYVDDQVGGITVITDHGGLSGLGDDDHTQYSLADGSRDFSGEVVVPSPTASGSAANKGYVDTEIATNIVTDHGALGGLGDDDHTQYSLADGTRAFSGEVVVPSPTAGGSAANKGYVDTQVAGITVITEHGGLSGLTDDDHTQYTRADGTRAFTGDQSMGSNKLTSLSSPTTSADASNKGYVDAQISALPPVITDHGALGGLGDDDHTQYSLADGSRDFTGEVVVPSPTAAGSAANKGYVDGQLTANVITDHGALGGLADDDHTQYSLVDGTRAFSGEVAVPSPTVAGSAANKGYVDAEVGGISLSINDLSDVTLTTPAVAHVLLYSGATWTNFSLDTLYATTAHGSVIETHILGGSDAIDADKLGIDFTPTHYSPSTESPTHNNVDHLSSHLSGIDNRLGAVGVFAIWAEENAALGTGGATEWAFGNGANMPSGQGVLVPKCELFAAALSLASGTATVDIEKNGTNAYSMISGGAATPNNTYTELSSPVQFAAGDVVGFTTNTSSGTGTPNVVTAWFRTVL